MNMLKNKRNFNLSDSESGFASIVIALVLIIVLGLMTVGFAELARSEQQQALNKQLANQAYDAAESGINDAISEIAQNKLTNAQPNTCINTSEDPDETPYSSAINTPNGVAYPCLMVNLTPPNVVFNQFAPLTNRYLLFSTVNNNNPASAGSFTIDWKCDESDTNCNDNDPGNVPTKTVPASTGDLQSTPIWSQSKYPPMLEVSITALGAQFSRADLENNTYTAFLYPNSSSNNTYSFNNSSGTIGTQNTVTDSDGLNAPIIGGGCSGSTETTTGGYLCTVTLNGFPNGDTQYLISLDDYYEMSDVSVSAQTSEGSALDMKGGQAIIDSTGQAHNVLKRIEEVVPIGENATNINEPAEALQGANICKLLITQPDPTKGTQSQCVPQGLD